MIMITITIRRSGEGVEEGAKAGGFGDEGVAGLGGGDFEVGGAVEEFEDGGAFLTLGVERFGGDGGGDLRVELRGGDHGVGEVGLGGGDHVGIIGWVEVVA
jgi:hypothetical protein